jgi:hypothetical protein
MAKSEIAKIYLIGYALLLTMKAHKRIIETILKIFTNFMNFMNFMNSVAGQS